MNTTTIINPAEIHRALVTLVPAGNVFEIRILGPKILGQRFAPKAGSGYFTSPDKAIEALQSAGLESAKGIYLTLNPVNHALIARADNRIAFGDVVTTSDKDITTRHWLLIDCDPNRPANVSASDEEKQTAYTKSQEVFRYLNGLGFPYPIMADSGNGYHLLYRIELPTDDGELVKRFLAALDAQFSNDKVKIDATVFNPARICKLYGTLAAKGDDCHEHGRPWRMSKLESIPDEVCCVSREQLEMVAMPAKPMPTTTSNSGAAIATLKGTHTQADVERFIAAHLADCNALPAEQYRNGLRWRLKVCPWNDQHIDSTVITLMDGIPGFRCQHDSCKCYHWRELAARYRGDNTASASTVSAEVNCAAIWQARLFDPLKVPPPMRAILKLIGRPTSTPGNLTVFYAPPKVGKSAVMQAAIASAMPGEGDMLGFESSNPDGKAIIHADTEQAPEDHWHQVQRILRRAGLVAAPKWFQSSCLTGLGYARIWACIQTAMRIAADQHGGIHSLFIDGFADLVADVNDPAESNDFVAQLHDMAISFDCPIIGVIHLNPGTEKTRGHLGSQLERKAETNLRLEKDGDITTIYSDKQRREPIPKSIGPCFQWSDELQMHVSCQTRLAAKSQIEREALTTLAQDIYAGRPAMKYSDLVSTIKSSLIVSSATADRKVKALSNFGIISKSVAGLYVLKV